jgi:hypothetical protein
MNAARLTSLLSTGRLFRPDPPSGAGRGVTGDVFKYADKIGKTCT